MKKLLNFVFWPALAGLTLSLALLAAPSLFKLLPILQHWFPQPVIQQLDADYGSLSFRDAISKAFPAVVSINNLQLVNRKVRGTSPLLPNVVVVGNLQDTNNTLGSGVIISPDGYIVTSYHVMFNPDLEILRPEQDITITLNDGRNLEARLISLDAKNDLALLKVDVGTVTHLQMASNSDLMAGDIVLAIGNPRNIGQSVSQGIISALRRLGDSFIIQTDASINPGNSGGALIDIHGNLIGINSTIVSESGGSEGISYAVPASKALEMLTQYLTAQKMDSGKSGYLGVDSDDYEIFESDDQQILGLVISGVSSGSAADKAGILPGDIIISVNDKAWPIINVSTQEEAYEMLSTISTHAPGELVMLEIIRSKNVIRVPTILGIGEPKVVLPENLPAAKESIELITTDAG